MRRLQMQIECASVVIQLVEQDIMRTGQLNDIEASASRFNLEGVSGIIMRQGEEGGYSIWPYLELGDDDKWQSMGHVGLSADVAQRLLFHVAAQCDYVQVMYQLDVLESHGCVLGDGALKFDIVGQADRQRTDR